MAPTEAPAGEWRAVEVSEIKPEDVLNFWFGGAARDAAGLAVDLARWFNPDPQFDRLIGERFGHAIGRAARGEFAAWELTARGRLALIILFDQFPRNVFRRTGQAFMFDKRAVELAMEGLEANVDDELPTIERLFFYLPLLHSESASDQKRSVACFRHLASEAGLLSGEMQQWFRLARNHRLIITVFGRFPHRNLMLQRRSTMSERLFLFSCRLRRSMGSTLASLRRRQS
jgi:uncharacterized protein (DUF924 family)